MFFGTINSYCGGRRQIARSLSLSLSLFSYSYNDAYLRRSIVSVILFYSTQVIPISLKHRDYRHRIVIAAYYIYLLLITESIVHSINTVFLTF